MPISSLIYEIKVVGRGFNAIRFGKIFELFKRNLPQTIVSFVIDHSWSMSGEKLATAKQSASSMIHSFKEGLDHGVVVLFSDKITTDRTIYSDKSILIEKINNAKADGATSLYDAIMEAATPLSNASDNLLKIMVVLTDGEDVSSKSNVNDCIGTLNNGSFMSYLIGIGPESGKGFFDRLSLINQEIVFQNIKMQKCTVVKTSGNGSEMQNEIKFHFNRIRNLGIIIPALYRALNLVDHVDNVEELDMVHGLISWCFWNLFDCPNENMAIETNMAVKMLNDRSGLEPDVIIQILNNLSKMNWITVLENNNKQVIQFKING
jgi:hypothetical protein